MMFILTFIQSAVIGDMVSSMTEASAAITGIWQIPQCSCASAAYTLSNKKTYPYFFRTVGNVVLYGESLVDWVSSMGWTMFALIYTNDAVGQQVLHTILDQANKRHVTAMTNIPLYSLMDEQIEGKKKKVTSYYSIIKANLLRRGTFNVREFRVSRGYFGRFRHK